MSGVPLLQLCNVVKRFPLHSPILHRRIGHVSAVDGVDLEVHSGATTGLVGESGSGKTTLARVALRLIEPTAGEILLDGNDQTSAGGGQLRRLRRQMQLVFQDPYSSLDPLSPVEDSVGEPLEVHEGLGRRDRDAKVIELLEMVGLDPRARHRYPREFSGGQLQRLAIARALAVEPRLLVLDEPVSSLDVSTQAEVVNLLADLQAELGIGFLLIAHDLALVEHVSHRIAVMYLGQIVEEGAAERVVRDPHHPYTQALLSAVPVPDPIVQRRRERIMLAGEPPSPVAPPPGCRFHTRCAHVMEVCRSQEPVETPLADGGFVRCHLHVAPEGLPDQGPGGSPARHA